MKNLKLSLLGVLCLAFQCGFGQGNKEARKVEKLIANVVDKAMAASVYIIEWDTLKNKVQEGVDEANGFTGVVVSAEGHILTVSHAAMPNQVYMISFPDGSKRVAVGLGRIGLQDQVKDYDMAMVKILKPGKWAFAKMAPSTELKLNQPVVSISYPGAFFKQTPNVRFGRISDVDLSDGFIESSAKMEPGDSGGPLFDEHGRVVGIHSWIKENENQNYDVPADHFLKYWTALNVAKDYKEFPAADDLPPLASSVLMETVPALDEVVAISARQQKSVVTLNSSRGTQDLSIKGTLIDFGGTTYIISKNSMLGNNPVIKIGYGTVSVQIIKRDRDHDLVLLKAPQKQEGGIRLKSNAENPELRHEDLGKILISAFDKDSIKTGILSATYIDVPLNASRGYLGAGAAYQDGKVTLSRIGRNSAVASILKAKDQVIKINGIAVKSAADYDSEFAKYIAADSISLDIIREGNPMQVNVYLEGQPTVRHVSFEYPGGRSARSDGFNQVLVHDAAIKANECGSPVFDTGGKFYGINIARRSRTSSILMPVATLAGFLKNYTKK